MKAVRAAVLCGALALVLAPAGCAKKLKYDAARIEKRCPAEPGAPLTAERARCIARVAGLRDKKRCPMVVDVLVGDDGAPRAHRVRESCSGLGIEIDGIGRIVAVEYGSAVSRD